MTIQDIFADLPSLSTERLVLRRMSMDDAADMFENSSDPEMTRYVGWDAHRTIEDSRAFLATVIEQYHNGHVANWGIEQRENGRLIGTCGFIYWNITHARAEIGYALGRKYWNMGYMTEAVDEVLRFGFQRMELNRIEARCEVENIASARVMEKCGMSFEGVLRQHMLVRGSFRDLKMYSILRGEWEQAHAT
jgi:ribosomal-protein-alanine N-acetyltransferase